MSWKQTEFIEFERGVERRGQMVRFEDFKKTERLGPGVDHDEQVQTLSMLLGWIKARGMEPELNVRRL